MLPLPRSAIQHLKTHLAPDFDRRAQAIKKHYEPLLLIPIGIGILLGNVAPITIGGQQVFYMLVNGEIAEALDAEDRARAGLAIRSLAKRLRRGDPEALDALGRRPSVIAGRGNRLPQTNAAVLISAFIL